MHFFSSVSLTLLIQLFFLIVIISRYQVLVLLECCTIVLSEKTKQETVDTINTPASSHLVSVYHCFGRTAEVFPGLFSLCCSDTFYPVVFIMIVFWALREDNVFLVFDVTKAPWFLSEIHIR